jgi:Leucine-rich repeat (LRR) protein
MEPEPKLLEVFLHSADVRSLEKQIQAALRLCNHQIKKVIDATVISCKVKPADVPLICSCEFWKLKELKIYGNWPQESLRLLPSTLFKKFPLLESLKIHGCTQLEALPENIKELKYLTSVIIHCNSLSTLPPLSGQLTALELYECRALTLEGLAPLKQLQQLKILEVGLILREGALFPEWICDNITTGLLDLRLRNARSLPSTITNFKHLTSLCLRESDLDDLPDSIGLLSSLVVLGGPSQVLDKLPESFSKLATLKELELNVNLNEIAPLQHFTELTYLDFTFHREAGLQNLAFIWNLTSLKSLLLWDVPDSNIFEVCSLSDDISKLQNLEYLYLQDIENMYALPESIGKLSSLTKIELCSVGLESLPNSIDNLKGLKSISIRYCEDLYALPQSIGGLDSLEELRVTYCDKLRKLPDGIGKLDALKVFVIIDCLELAEIPDSFADLVLGKDDENWSLEKVVIKNYYKLVFSPKMEQAMEVLRSRGVRMED